jgi:hypothetical protein
MEEEGVWQRLSTQSFIHGFGFRPVTYHSNNMFGATKTNRKILKQPCTSRNIQGVTLKIKTLESAHRPE